jgi:hypothetical protein
MALYDPGEFPSETVVSPDFTVADVLAWARTKPSGEDYNFRDARNCALAQFGIATGRRHLVGVGEVDAKYPAIYGAVNPLEDDFTFGGLVKRLEALV